MTHIPPAVLRQAICSNVAASLAEDEGAGDLTAGLIPANRYIEGTVIARHDAVIAGRPWVEETFRQVDPALRIHWHIEEGESVRVEESPRVFSFRGPARALLTAERTALNWLQTLSGVATRCQSYASLVSHTRVRLLDTRKTLPGLRIAQKYAVTQGGCHNHRLGLYDSFLIKENHIAACGSISKAVATARAQAPGRPVEVEAENLAEVEEAVAAGAEFVMLDEFSLADMTRAVRDYGSRVKLEASGGISEANLVSVAETGVDFISLGTLTKDVSAVDLSLRVTEPDIV